MLYLFLLLVSFLLILSVYINWILSIFCYLFVGTLIWVVCEGEPTYWKTILLWYPAILFNKPELLE